jgi:hypothetical protein
MDFSRQMELFDPEKFNTPIHVIGCGATGSWVTLQLAKLGVQNITVWDFDKVEEHNLPNQAFRLKYNIDKDDFALTDIGQNKVNALSSVIYSFTGVCIKTKNAKVDGSQRLAGIVFMLTDTMKSRKEIYEKAIKLNPGVKLLIETRMGLDGGSVYFVNPTDWKQLKKYEETFYSDEESAVSACGTSQSIVATANWIASMATWGVINYHNDVPLPFEVLLDCQNFNMMAK